ncbi:MAG: FAD-binding oxidoreductase [Gammaproteobacteria bacterium]|nr:FAD-binding oxidoreductase [Gammaproteobacteria bacterium]
MTEYLPQDENEKSLWGDSAIANPLSEHLQEKLKTDVLVVGGGYTGLSCALHLVQKGVSVVLLEACSIGFGGSGRNAGLVNAGVWQNPNHVVKVLGEAAGERFNLALRDSPELVFELIKRFDMPCQPDRRGTVNMAHNAAAMTLLEDRCRQMQNLGASVELIDGDRAGAISASPVYRYGGILDPDAGTIHPLNYARSLAKAALDLGVRMFEKSPILSLQRDDDCWLATTEQGKVSADQVVVATNAYADSNSQGVRESLLPLSIFHCATEPLPEDIATSIIPQRHGIWDTSLLLTSSRIDSAGRLVMSSPGRLMGFQRGIRESWMTRTRNRLYPQTKGLPWEYRWSGQVGVTSSKILRVQLLAPGVFAPAGYNGRGIGPGTVIGKHLADTLVSGNREEFPFPIEALYHEKWSSLRSAYYSYGTLALQFVDRRR